MRKRGRTRLTFQKPQPGNDGFGDFPTAGGWGDDVDIGVLLKPSRGNESEINGAVQGRQTYECEVRAHYVFASPGINTTWRAVDKATGRTFNVAAVAQKDDDFRWVRLFITAGETS